MSFWSDLGNALTGRNRLDITEATLSTQEKIAIEALKQKIAEDQLKYNPELAKQRTQQLTIIVVSVVIIAGLFIYFRFR